LLLIDHSHSKRRKRDAYLIASAVEPDWLDEQLDNAHLVAQRQRLPNRLELKFPPFFGQWLSKDLAA
jgi:hypothetical protein